MRSQPIAGSRTGLAAAPVAPARARRSAASRHGGGARAARAAAQPSGLPTPRHPWGTCSSTSSGEPAQGSSSGVISSRGGPSSTCASSGAHGSCAAGARRGWSLVPRAAAAALNPDDAPGGPGAPAGGAGAPDSSSGGAPPEVAAGSFQLPAFSPWSLGGPLAWSFLLGYIFFMLVLPIAALLGKASLIPLAQFWARATEPVALSAYYVSFSMAIVAALANAFFGFILAWVLVKFNFPGKKWIDAAVDLPFALPTSVAGLTLATVYNDDGVIGALLTKLGVNVVFTRLGVAVAMIFVSFPFVVRTMQPVLQEMEKEVEEAAWSLGASPWETFVRVLLPPLLPPLLTGTALAFSRALGEFGSIVIVSSNFPFKDLIAPVLIFQCLEQYDFVGATVIGTVLLLISMVMMIGVNYLQSIGAKGGKGE